MSLNKLQISKDANSGVRNIQDIMLIVVCMEYLCNAANSGVTIL